MNRLVFNVVFILLFFLSIKVLDNYVFSFAASLKDDTKKMISNNYEFKSYLKKYWLLLLTSIFLSATMTNLVITYIKLVVVLIVAIILYVFNVISQQDDTYNKHNVMTEQIVANLTAEAMSLIGEKRIYKIKNNSIKKSSKVLIYSFEIESALFFSDDGRTEFMYSFEKRMREESLKAIYIDKSADSKFKFYIEESGYSELLVTVAICLNEETKEQFESFYNAKSNSHKTINIEDEDF